MRDNNEYRYPPSASYQSLGVIKKFCQGRCQMETEHFEGVSWNNGVSEKKTTCVVCQRIETKNIPWEECVRLAPRATLDV